MMTLQYYSFIIFIFIGIFLSLVYDLFRILRKTYRTPDIITLLEDICFWLISGIILLYSIFEFNNGNIRGYIFIGIFFGVIIYVLLFSRVVLKYGTIILKYINKAIINPIFKLFSLIFNIIIKIIHILLKKIQKNQKNRGFF